LYGDNIFLFIYSIFSIELNFSGTYVFADFVNDAIGSFLTIFSV